MYKELRDMLSMFGLFLTIYGLYIVVPKEIALHNWLLAGIFIFGISTFAEMIILFFPKKEKSLKHS